jgi:hypothetical protein
MLALMSGFHEVGVPLAASSDARRLRPAPPMFAKKPPT